MGKNAKYILYVKLHKYITWQQFHTAVPQEVMPPPNLFSIATAASVCDVSIIPI
jgi:hypothetical protein